MPSYLGAWLFVLALPLGALPLVMASELLGADETRLLAALRRLVGVMPLAALAAVPVLLRLGTLYPGLWAAKAGLPGWWMTPGVFVVRAVVLLAAFTALASIFARPGASASARGGRRGVLAIAGLALHPVLATLAADDWAQQVEPGFNASSFGLVLVAAQCSIALCLAVVMVMTGRGGRVAARGAAEDRRDVDSTIRVGTGLAVALGFWGFLVFTQYLVVWSANLPREVLWYQHRSAGLGQAGGGGGGAALRPRARRAAGAWPVAPRRRAGLDGGGAARPAWARNAVAGDAGLPGRLRGDARRCRGPGRGRRARRSASRSCRGDRIGRVGHGGA